MGKITFRADDDLVDELETFDVSKSEVMREALRTYLGHGPSDAPATGTGDPSDSTAEEPSIDELVDDRIDELLADRLEDRSVGEAQDVHVRISVDADGEGVDDRVSRRHAGGTQSRLPDPSGIDAPPERPPTGGSPGEVEPGASESPTPCLQCGTAVDADHVYCPNCGEKAARRVFCECGDEVRSDWSFCPSCGRRTPAAGVLDSR